MTEFSPMRWSPDLDQLELLDQTLLRRGGALAALRAPGRRRRRDPPPGGARRAGDRSRRGLRAGAWVGAKAVDLARTIHARLLAATRPTAVNLRWALDRGARGPRRSATAAGGDGIAEAPRSGPSSSTPTTSRPTGASANTAQPFSAPGDRVLTHCNTGALATAGYGTALGVIRAAHESGCLSHVWVDETRPLLQGARLTAWELQRLGFPFRLITDSSAGALMARGLVDRVVVGADRIAANGDTANKIGTYTVAVLAHRHGVPFYVAAPLSTIDRATAERAIRSRSRSAIRGRSRSCKGCRSRRSTRRR